MRIFLALLVCTPALMATVIVQKNGDVISGRILQERKDRYIFQSPYGKLQIAKANVSKLILDEKQIELQDVKYKDQTVKARLVAQDDKTSVFLTDDGRTIRTDAPTSTATDDKAEKRDTWLFAASGMYGFSTFQRLSTDGPPGFDQAFAAGAFGAQLTGHYTFSPIWGVGVATAFYRHVLVQTVPQPGAPPDYEATAAHASVFVSPSLVVSLLGNLGSKKSAHDIRLEVQPGYSLNEANLDLRFIPPTNPFPASAAAAGKTSAFTLQGQLSYSYSLSESLRLRLGAAYYRVFYDRIFDGTLQNGSAIPGGFTADFERALKSPAQNPQIISITLGAEIGF
ncbi:hypothetical protein Turpa_2358 [Turneriella parva DSM 21527]|uniref:Outer membrane protein beta-barrel domain-containing protein n=1 Tax=Turneriella parva (strain ATCC BAA-1111 / DSM 21527 / NCTC 11395 / H) TaxID=869212 RepID=I4B6U4_TURPD|nr:hypothetical protein Turpa_2358 [Turneriella parva DSM 21527]